MRRALTVDHGPMLSRVPPTSVGMVLKRSRILFRSTRTLGQGRTPLRIPTAWLIVTFLANVPPVIPTTGRPRPSLHDRKFPPKVESAEELGTLGRRAGQYTMLFVAPAILCRRPKEKPDA